ncbi:hypothetical protein C4K22_3213 [Pseudomonas chlororaphis subsp. aurantiaca]|nr:hypothetical protein C4K22_3213 [Pseudomonas chlororaphis subsp. aurantiaca]AZD92613.1 hypothetical protein C4K13_3196 [Pseudomonas chlororaphis subsp. aureofaciens]SDS90512.1 hypothetical protein SAMN04489803_2532 [Pseudomonas chlororaphis]AZD42293.1 hypothetical protein C4K21_3219 [Pseudomonas chlororaphis subsp. aurantiaca]AZD48490.1 hypothetical protein C4K20_3075 [Pseudomonas chlororaphis subsp. aurantiaca]
MAGHLRAEVRERIPKAVIQLTSEQQIRLLLIVLAKVYLNPLLLCYLSPGTWLQSGADEHRYR